MWLGFVSLVILVIYVNSCVWVVGVVVCGELVGWICRLFVVDDVLVVMGWFFFVWLLLIWFDCWFF